MKKQKYIIKILVLVLSFLFIMTSCDFFLKKDEKINDEEISMEVSDVVEWPVIIKGVEITEKPINVVSLSPSLTELSFEFGYFDRLTGVSDFCDYPSNASEMISVGNVNVLDLDKLFEIRPDYIILQSPLSDKNMELINFQGIKIVEFTKGSSLEETMQMYKDLFLFFDGLVEGKMQGDKYVESFMEQIEKIKESIPESSKQSLKGLYLNGVKDMAASKDTFEGEMLEILEIDNIAKNHINWDFNFSDEGMQNADIIFLASETDIEEILSKEELENIKAYKNNKIIKIDTIVLERQTPRVVTFLKDSLKNLYGITYSE